MAAVSSTQTASATFSPINNNTDNNNTWNYPDDHTEYPNDDKTTYPRDNGITSPSSERNGNAFASGSGGVTRKMKAAEKPSNNRWDEPTNADGLLPAFSPEPTSSKSGATFGSRPNNRNGDHQNGPDDHVWAYDPASEDSKWIHRDKLAKIENEELQAAGIFVPRSRAPSKQRRDRSRSAMRRGTDASDSHNNPSRSRKNSSAVDQRTAEVTVPSWDLRTPEEIAEEEKSAYFTTSGLKGGSRIPVAKTSPAPISLEWMAGGQSTDEDGLAYPKTRSRSGSASLSGLEKANSVGTMAGAKRSATDVSPKKNATGNRKASSGARSTSAARPKTRSGSSSGTTRPSTRSGESPPSKQPEGDPPWINTYQPDPRLPPDQQLLPTVAKRLQQEKWEKEGTYGDVYDKEFRPLNDKALKSPPPEAEKSLETSPTAEEQPQQLLGADWPLKPEAARSPNIRQGSYSTMPKISDKHPGSPMGSPRPPQTPQMFPVQSHPQTVEDTPRVPDEKEDEKKGGCGCCIVM